MSAEARLPGYLRFMWMFFMQPVSLHHRLKACGIEEPGAPGWRLWRDLRAKHELRRVYFRRLIATLALMPPTAVALALFLRSLAIEVTWGGVAYGVAFGMAISGIGLAFGVAFGVAYGVALGVSFSMAYGVAFGKVSGAGYGAAFGAGFGVAVGVDQGTTKGAAASVFYGVAIGVFSGVAVGVFYGVFSGLAEGMAYGVATGVAFPLTYLRFPLYPVEALHQTLLYWRQKLFGILNLDTSPVLWHELSYLPLPFLARHIEITAEHDPQLARRALAACEIAPGQRRLGRLALTRIQGRELERIGREGRFRALVDGETKWLPPDASANVETVALRQVARYALAAASAQTPGQRLDHLRRAQKDLDGIEVTLLERRSSRRSVLAAWQHTIAKLRAKAEREAEGRLANPFRAGEPLEPDLGREVFRGREEVVRHIERLLADPTRSASIALLAPRRCGKTSVLKMLPELLPDAVCIFFDLQEHPVDTPAGFFRALDRETRVQARRDRGIELPALGDGTPFEAAGRWIEALEGAAGDRRLLFCLDEFETLERTFPGSRRDLLKLMGLFRSIIQHRRGVRLLVSGEAPFDELDAIWNDHFISVREVRFGHLDAAVARELVQRPTSEFPAETMPDAVAARIVERTGGQPFLVQLYAQLLVELLNDEDRRRATLDDLERGEQEVLEQAGYYFRNSWQRGPDSVREALAALARGEVPELGRSARRWLRRRELIDDQDRLTIPVLGRFLIETELV